MFNTYKMMSSIPLGKLEDMDINEVVHLFQTTKDPKVQNKCFAYVFTKNFKMFLKIFNKYPIANEIDRTEECIGAILRSLRQYNFTPKTKFSSFVYGNVCRCFMTLTDSVLKNNKKKIWQCIFQGDAKEVEFALNSIRDKSTTNEYNLYMKDLENSSILNGEEIAYCQGLLMGYKNSSEVVKAMHIDKVTRYNKTNKCYIDIPITEDNVKMHISKLRKKLKDKVKNNNYSFL